MVEQPVTHGFGDHDLQHGASLHEALVRLGFVPDVLCWGVIGGELELILITSLADRIGTLELYETIFRAQDWGAIPREFDLLRLSIYSPKSELGGDIERVLAGGTNAEGTVPYSPGDKVDRVVYAIGITDPFIIPGQGIYSVLKSGFDATQDMRRWKKFQQNVDRLAA